MNNSFIIEGMPSVSAVIANARTHDSNSNRRITDVYFDMAKIAKYDRQNYARYKFLKSNSDSLGYTFHECSDENFVQLVDSGTHGGVAAKCSFDELPTLSENDLASKACYCYLDGVDDPYNLGYIIRSMYAFGAKGVILPKNNKMNLFPSTVIRSSAGTTERLDMFVSEPDELCRIFKKNGYRIVCTALRDSVPCREADLTSPMLLVIGGEKRGISRQILSNADLNVRIEYAVDFMGSLPAVSAAAVLGYEMSRQN